MIKELSAAQGFEPQTAAELTVVAAAAAAVADCVAVVFLLTPQPSTARNSLRLYLPPNWHASGHKSMDSSIDVKVSFFNLISTRKVRLSKSFITGQKSMISSGMSS